MLMPLLPPLENAVINSSSYSFSPTETSVACSAKSKAVKKQRLFNVLLVTSGFILSPLTWWNDLVVNIPLAYLFSIPFTLLHDNLFLPSFVIGYWFTNLLGFINPFLYLLAGGLKPFPRFLFRLCRLFLYDISLLHAFLYTARPFIQYSHDGLISHEA